MNINKLETMLCLAFQESDGPFDIVIRFRNNEKLPWRISASKEEIKKFSNEDCIEYIALTNPIKDRRWIGRQDNDRRKNTR